MLNGADKTRTPFATCSQCTAQRDVIQLHCASRNSPETVRAFAAGGTQRAVSAQLHRTRSDRPTAIASRDHFDQRQVAQAPDHKDFGELLRQLPSRLTGAVRQSADRQAHGRRTVDTMRDMPNYRRRQFCRCRLAAQPESISRWPINLIGRRASQPPRRRRYNALLNTPLTPASVTCSGRQRYQACANGITAGANCMAN